MRLSSFFFSLLFFEALVFFPIFFIQPFNFFRRSGVFGPFDFGAFFTLFEHHGGLRFFGQEGRYLRGRGYVMDPMVMVVMMNHQWGSKIST